MNIEIVSVAKKIQTFQDVSSAVYVITAEDIHRAGATQLVDVLNLVPGAFFADFTSNAVNAGIRSPGSSLPQSVLVLVDGMPMNLPTTGSPPFEFIDIPVRQVEPDTNDGLILDPPADQFDLGLVIEKRFLQSRWGVQLWGRNLLVDELSSGHSVYLEIGYPHTVHRTFGGGVDLRF
jgi:hypothetical protein